MAAEQTETVVIDENEIESLDGLTPEQESEMDGKFLYSMDMNAETGEITICPMNDENCITLHGEAEVEFFINNLRGLVQKGNKASTSLPYNLLLMNARDIIIDAGKVIAERLLQTLQPIVVRINEILSPVEEFLHTFSTRQKELRSVATPRQWHLYLYGRPRVSRKWEHIFEKRLMRKKKKGGGTDES